MNESPETTTGKTDFDWKNFDCRTCGACCQQYDDIQVYMDEPSFQFLREKDLVQYNPYQGYWQMKSVPPRYKRCIALVGQIGIDAHCSIYEDRPQVCREYAVNTHRCRTSRFVQIKRELNVELPKTIFGKNANRIIREVLKIL